MNTTTKEKQIVVNVSQEAKDQFKLIKERFGVTDKDLMDYLLDMFNSAKPEDINAGMIAFTLAKKKAKVDAKIARFLAKQGEKIKKLREAIEAEEETISETVSETTEESVDELVETAIE